MYYFDAAYVAKCYLNDPDSERVRNLVREPVVLVSSALSIAEVSCAIHRRMREKALTRKQGDELCKAFREHVEEGVWSLVPVTERLLWDVSQALRTLSKSVFIRTGDAIHLISARQEGCTAVWTNDGHMLLAARYFGLKGRSA